MRKDFMPTRPLIEAAELVFLATAREKMIRPIVEKYQTKVLAEGQWPMSSEYLAVGEDRKIILSPIDAWCLSDEHALIYYARIEEERVKSGLTVIKEGNCPLLEAKADLTKAQQALIQALQPETGLDWNGLLNSGIENLNKAIELSMRLMAPWMSRDNIMLRLK